MKFSLKNFSNLFIERSEPIEPKKVHSKAILVFFWLLLLVWIMGQIGIFNKPTNSFIRTNLTGLLVLVSVIYSLTSKKRKTD